MTVTFRCRQAFAVVATALCLLLGGTAACAAAALPDSGVTSVPELLGRLERSIGTAQGTNRLYAFAGRLEQGELTLSGPEDARRFAEACGAYLLRGEGVAPMRAAELLARYPHPAATEALLAFVSPDSQAGKWDRESALRALVSLREPRVLPILVRSLEHVAKYSARGGGQLQIGLLAELGDPAGVPVLRRMIGNSAYCDSCVADERRHAARYSPRQLDSPAWQEQLRSSCRAESADAASAATRAIRDIERFVRDGTVAPFDLGDSTWASLQRNGFAVTTETHHEMYEFLSDQYPLVTSDIAFHAFALLARAALGELDSLVLLPRVTQLCEVAGDACLAWAKRAKSGEGRAAALRDAECLAVAAALLRDETDAREGLPSASREAVRRELLAVRAHAEPGPSLLPAGHEDFTKYVPRGRFSNAPASAGYFQAMVWLGRANMAIAKDDGLRRALVLAQVLRDDAALRGRWSEWEGLLRGLYGPCEELSLVALAAKLDSARFGGSFVASGSPECLARVRVLLQGRPAPSIRSADLSQGPRDGEDGPMIALSGQAYTRAAHLLQLQLDAGVWPPTMLALAAAPLGSARARAMLDTSVVRALANAPQRARFPAHAPLDLPEEALQVLARLFTVPAGAPEFMKRPAWEEKQVNTALGAYAEVGHMIAPFAKDAGKYSSASAVLDRFHGWVEPIPEFYAALDTLTRGLQARLERVGVFARIESSLAVTRGVPTARPPLVLSRMDLWTRQMMAGADSLERVKLARVRVTRASFQKLSVILRRLETIARAELRGEPQSLSDGVFLKSLGRQFCWLAFNRSSSAHANESMAIVHDPATEYYRGECLEVGVGLPHALYVRIPDGDRSFVCRGAVYSYYEFVRPIAQRLDDANWRVLLETPASGMPEPWWNSRSDWRPVTAERAGLRGGH